MVYKDAAGSLLFTFDVSPAAKQSGRKSNLHLDKGELIEVGGKLLKYGNTASERERLAMARERVREYAASCGYVVIL